LIFHRFYVQLQCPVEASSIMAITSASSSIQSAWQQLQLQQARRNVEQAEQNANSLQQQANNAQAQVQSAQAQANALWNQASQAQSTANQESAQLQTATAWGQIGANVSKTVTQVVSNLAVPKSPVPSAAVAAASSVVSVKAPSAVVNTHGQTTGTIINTTA
jgi:multidrug resistance efflux pump